MQLNDKVQHVYLVGAKSLGAYGGYETFVYKLTEYHQNKENIKYHVAYNPSLNSVHQPIIQPLITPTLRSASGQGERPGGSPGPRTLRGVAH